MKPLYLTTHLTTFLEILLKVYIEVHLELGTIYYNDLGIYERQIVLGHTLREDRQFIYLTGRPKQIRLTEDGKLLAYTIQKLLE